jgi:hypothetical protein
VARRRPRRGDRPTFLLFDYSYRPASVYEEQAVAWAAASGVRSADEDLLAPDPYNTCDDWCAARVQATEARLEALPATSSSSSRITFRCARTSPCCRGFRDFRSGAALRPDERVAPAVQHRSSRLRTPASAIDEGDRSACDSMKCRWDIRSSGTSRRP